MQLLPGERMTRLLKRPSEIGQFWRGKSVEDVLRKSSSEPSDMH